MKFSTLAILTALYLWTSFTSSGLDLPIYQLPSNESRSGGKCRPIKIKPGLGIDNIKLVHSSHRQIRIYKAMNYKMEVTYDTTGTETNIYSRRNITFYSKKASLKFYFVAQTWYQSWPKDQAPFKQKMRLKEITVWNNPCACTLDSICIGKSAEIDVKKLYGEANEYQSGGYLELQYPEKGISFHSDQYGIVKKIMIFPPVTKKKKPVREE